MFRVTFLPTLAAGLILAWGSSFSCHAVLLQIIAPETSEVDGYPFFANAIVSQDPLPGVAMFPSFSADLSQSSSITIEIRAPEGEFFQWIPDSNPDSGMLVNLTLAYGDVDPDLPRLTATNTTLTFVDLLVSGDEPFIPAVETEFAEDGSFFEILQCTNCFDQSGSATFTGMTLHIDYSGLSEASSWSFSNYDASAESVLWFVTLDVQQEVSDRSLLVIPEPGILTFLGLATGLLLLRRWRVGWQESRATIGGVQRN